MTDDQSKKLYSISEAAEYLGLTESGVTYHVYTTKELVPDKKYPRLVLFFQSTLDAFKAQERKPGPKPKSQGTRRRKKGDDQNG